MTSVRAEVITPYGVYIQKYVPSDLPLVFHPHVSVVIYSPGWSVIYLTVIGKDQG